MCGRYTLRLDLAALQEAFPQFSFPQEIEPRYNVAPTQDVPVVPNDGEQQVKLFHWGLIPFWAKDPGIGNRMINARSETAAEKPSFRAAFRRRRCLVLADGFFEWQKVPGSKSKVPMYVRMVSGEPFAFAGLWEVWRPEEGADPTFSCTILTTEPNELIAPIHNRMPVIMPRRAYDLWLEPSELDAPTLQGLLKPYPAEALEAYPVSKMVNSPRNDDPQCIAPLAG